MECKMLLSWATVYVLSLCTVSVAQHRCDYGYVCSGVCCCSSTSEGTEANCTHRNLTGVPADLPAYTARLHLDFNNISSLPANAFQHLFNLRYLKLLGNNLSSLDKNVFRGLTNLHTLNLRLNLFQKFPSEAFHAIPRLQKLHLDSNYLTSIPHDIEVSLPSLAYLDLKENQLTSVPTGLLHHARSLRVLILNSTAITTIPRHAFTKNTALAMLYLDRNQIQDIHEDALVNASSLFYLNLDQNQLARIPTAALGHAQALTELLLNHNFITVVHTKAFVNNTNLTKLSLSYNRITHIAADAFAGLPNLEYIVFKQNPVTTVGHTAFRNLNSLIALEISDVENLSIFPDLTGTTNLKRLTIDRCSLTSVPENFCDMTELNHLDLHNNLIANMPNFSCCTKLQHINLGYNKLTSLGGRPFYGLTEMHDISLPYNAITHVPGDAFETLSDLNSLNLRYNAINSIDKQAFAPFIRLEFLYLSGNSFPVLPSAGLQCVIKLHTDNNDQLEDFPSPSELPNVYNVTTSYGYHCCDFIELMANFDSGENGIINESTYFFSQNTNEFSFLWQDLNYTWRSFTSFFYDSELWNQLEYSWLSGELQSCTPLPHKVNCTPKPGPFIPCVDLFGSWPLRIGVWLVFLLAIVGNAVVICVILISHTKMDVPRFLICNLAFADFFLGVYLGFLAGVDASTLGVFKRYGAYWQLSAGCRMAGFLAVFSSELSIYTLSVITLERFYAIKHALHLEKRMKLPHAVGVMCIGWIFSVVAAILPLVHVSSYYKFPVCLPFDVETTVAKAYVSSILLLNIIAFVIIMSCYASIYLAIQGSHAWNCNDSRVARRMSLLVFTDFACWAPIAFFSLTSAFGLRLISLNGAKVLTIFVLPLNSCANPFLYTILTKQFKKDCKMIMRSLSNRVFRQRSMSRSITLSLGRHPSTRSTQAHQTSQLRWRTNGSISQDVSGDPYLVSSFKTDNGESNIYTVSNVSNLTEPLTLGNKHTNGSSSNDQSHSESSTMLDPNTNNSTLDDLRRGSSSPLLDLLTHVKSKTQELKPKTKSRRKFSIPIPFFSSRSPSRTTGDGSATHSPARNSPLGQRHKRSYSVTEGLLHKMGRKKPLTSMKSAPGITMVVSRSSEQLHQQGNGCNGVNRATIPENKNPEQEKTERKAEVKETQNERVVAIQDTWTFSSPLLKSSMDQDTPEAQCLLEAGRSYSDPRLAIGESLDDSEAVRLLSSSHDNPVRDQLSSASPSPLLHRPQDLELGTTSSMNDETRDCDSGLGTASSPFPYSTECTKFLPDSPNRCRSHEEFDASEADSPTAKGQTSGLGSIFVHLTRSDQTKCYNGVPGTPGKPQQDSLSRPRESTV